MRSFLKIVVAVALAVMSIAGIGGVVAAAPPAGSITGSVHTDNGTAINGAYVTAYDWNTDTIVGGADTIEDGTYSITGLPSGSYRVMAEEAGYLPEYWNEASTYGDADLVPVTDPSATPDINFTLTPSTSISGYIYHEDGITPIPTAVAAAYENVTQPGTWKLLAYDYSGADGSYSISTGTGSGTYLVMAQGRGYAVEYYDNVTAQGAATPVMVSPGNDATDINFTLAQIGCISGKVYKADGVTPLSGAAITAYDNVTGLYVDSNYSGATDGLYYINLAPGTYRIGATRTGYIDQYWDNVTTKNDATPITVVGVGENGGHDFYLLGGQAVATNAATSIGDTSATLNGNLTSKGLNDNVTVSFEYDTDSGEPYAQTTAGSVMNTTGAFSIPLSGLASHTTYYFRAKAVGDVDTTPFYGSELSFTTSTVPPSVTTDNATNVATSSATLNGNLTVLGTASSVNVSFEWGLTTSYGTETAAVAKTDLGTFTANVTGLATNTTYHFRAKADGDGDPVYGADMSFTTSTTPPTVSTGAASSLATTSATLNGSLGSMGAAASVIVSFEWGTATGSYTHTTDNQTLSATGAFTANLTGLTPGTTYYYKAKAVGQGTALGGEVSFVTSTTPPTVSTGAASSVAATSATLNGSLSALGTATTVNVSFEWGTTTSYGTETAAQSLTATGAFTVNLTGLTAKTTYHFRAKAVGHGSAVYGEDKTFTLPDTTAPTITVVASSGITKAEATITWTTSEAATSKVEYGLDSEYGSATDESTSLVTSHSVGLTGLKAGKTYHYRVVSKDSAGNQALSEDYTFKTESSSGGMPVWAWVIIAVVVVGAVGGGAFFFMKRGKAA